MVSAYAPVLRSRSLMSAVGSVTLGGIAALMAPICIVFAVEETTGSFGSAGLVVAAHNLGYVLTAPVRGRLVDRRGGRRVLPLVGIVWAAPLAVISLGPHPLGVLAALAAVSGAGTPPLIPLLRSLPARELKDDDALRAAYSVVAVLNEVMFLIGPLLAGALVAAVSPAGALGAAAAAGFAATVACAGLAIVDRPLESDARPPSGGGPRLAGAGMGTLVASSVGFGAAFGALDIGVPMFSDDRGGAATAGVLLSLVAAGSIAGGLAYGAVRGRGSTAYRFVVGGVAMAVALAVLPLAGTSLAAGAVLVATGAAVGPMTVAMYELLDDVAPPEQSVEAMSWVTTAYAVGLAAGTAATGAAIGRASEDLILALPALCAGLGATVALVGYRSLERQGSRAGAAAEHSSASTKGGLGAPV